MKTALRLAALALVGVSQEDDDNVGGRFFYHLTGDVPCGSQCWAEGETCVANGSATDEIPQCVYDAMKAVDFKGACGGCIVRLGVERMGIITGDKTDEEPSGSKGKGKNNKGKGKDTEEDKKEGDKSWDDVQDWDMDVSEDDCNSEIRNCMSQGVQLSDVKAMYFCMVISANKSNNLKCGGYLTSEGEDGDAMIGMTCLPDMALCATASDTIDDMFDKCLMDAVSAGTITEKCGQTYDRMVGPLGKLQMAAEKECPTELASCLGLMELNSTEDIDDDTEWPVMECVANFASTDKCAQAMEKLMAASTCAMGMDGDDGEDEGKKVADCMKANPKSMCQKQFEESGACPEETCIKNEKTGNCFSKKSAKKSDDPCAKFCEPYMPACVAEGKTDKKSMEECIMGAAGQQTRCGSCIIKMKQYMDKDDDEDKDDGEKVVVKATKIRYQKESDCKKGKKAKGRTDVMMVLGCNKMESGSVKLSCPAKNGSLQVDVFDSVDCEGPVSATENAAPTGSCQVKAAKRVEAMSYEIPAQCQDAFLQEWDGSWAQFKSYCGRQESAGCKTCSGKFNSSSKKCTPPSKTNKVKCGNFKNPAFCAKVNGCSMTSKGCKGKPKFGN